MPASKRARKIRVASEFDALALQRTLRVPSSSSGMPGWDIPTIVAARDNQIAGDFELPVRLAERMRTDDACFTAWKNRLAPQRAVATKLVPAPGKKGEAVAYEADGLFGPVGIGITLPTCISLHSDIANHGLAIGHNEIVPREDGSRIDIYHHHWPLEFVRYNATTKLLETRTSSGERLSIVHGDGRWVVYSCSEYLPWRDDAAVLPMALVWAAHAFGVRDWMKGSTSHGNAKYVGELPEGFPLQEKDSDGNAALSEDATTFLALLQDIASLDTPVGLKPAGSKIEILSNPANMWQIFDSLIGNREKAAARIYLGTDGTLGSVVGAPGVDTEELFGVSQTIVEGDFGALERGFLTGVIEIWAALNFGDSSLAPAREYVLPDADAEAVHDAFAKRQAAFHSDIKAYRDNGFVVDQALVDQLARLHDVPVPTLPNVPTITAQLVLAPTDIAKVVRVDEVRVSRGLPPIGDDRGQMTLPELESSSAAPAESAPQVPALSVVK